MSTEDNLSSLVADIDKIIKQIESDINRSNVTEKTINLLNELNAKRKELFSLKDNSKEFKRIKKRFGSRILALKKSLMFYYNSNIALMIYMQKEMYDNIEKIVDIDERATLLKKMNNLELPKLYNKDISNFQDPLNVDFNKFIYVSNKYREFENETSLIDKTNYALIEIGYIDRYVIPRISELIERYNNGERKITKESINLDILLCKIKIRDIERKYKDNDVISNKCLKSRNTLDNLSAIVTNSKLKYDNKEYFLLKDKIMFFSKEVKEYYEKDIKSDIDLNNFKDKYDSYLKEVETKYKSANIQLYNNLIKYLNEIKIIIERIENKEKEEEIKEDIIVEEDTKPTEAKESDGYYRVETIEEANDFYKKYSKPIMLASAVASMALVNTSVGPVLIPPIIFANVVAANKYPIIDKMNLILEKSIGAKRDSSKNVIKRNGIKLDIEDAFNGLLKGIALLDKKRKDVINDLIVRVKNSALVIKTTEYTNRLKDTYKVRKQELFDLKVIRLYYEFILSGLSLEEFCEDRDISNELFNELVDYMQYKEDNVRGLKK